MLFKVKRVSLMGECDDQKPCERCSKMMVREYGEESTEWGVEINTLEELMDFRSLEGDGIIIEASSVDTDTPTLVIYDDYIE